MEGTCSLQGGSTTILDTAVPNGISVWPTYKPVKRYIIARSMSYGPKTSWRIFLICSLQKSTLPKLLRQGQR
jgi:hypothetical protein